MLEKLTPEGTLSKKLSPKMTQFLDGPMLELDLTSFILKLI